MSHSVTVSSAGRVHRRRAALHRRLAGLSKHETSKVGLRYGMAGMALALVATIWLAIDADIETIGLILLAAAVGVRRDHRVLASPHRRDDRHARAHRAPAQLRRPRRRAVGWNGFLLVENDKNGENGVRSTPSARSASTTPRS